MQNTRSEQPVFDYYGYPLIGGDDWRYTYETAVVRALEIQLLSKAELVDLANAADFKSAVEQLASTAYALPPGANSIAAMEDMLGQRRSQVRQLFSQLCIDKEIAALFRTRDDFANLRLAMRRNLTQRPVGTGYSDEGNFSPQGFTEVFEQDNYELLPDYMQQATEQAVVAYYQKKDIRQIDYAIDAVQAQYNLRKARELESIFLLGLFKIQIDLTNVRTMVRLKFTQSQQRNVFLDGGFVQTELFEQAVEAGYEAVPAVFYSTPYYGTVDAGVGYLLSNNSFLGLEQQCQQHLHGFLATTIRITAGFQPVIAYLLNSEQEIRTVRLILTAKKNSLDTKLILDRLAT